jgi:hypothetical protein
MIGLVLTAWKHSGLEQAEEESCGQKSVVVLHEALTDGGQSEQKHAYGEPDSRLELFQKDIGWDLE